MGRERIVSERRLGLWGGMLVTVLVAVGCGNDAKSPPRSVTNTIPRAPVQPAPTPAAPLPLLQTTIDESPLTLIAAPPGYVVDARVLVISADGTDSELAAMEQTLGYLGTPFDVLIANQSNLTASMLASGTHGNYNAIVLTRGNLVLSNGTSAFSSAEFQTLATYEAAFQVRRVSLYTSPDAGYGYSGSVSQDTTGSALVAQCTSAGQSVFPYVNCASGVSISGVFAYPATPSDSSTIPLLVDASGQILAATRAYGDGREAMSLNFAQSASLFHTLQLFHGVVSWATRGVFLGERHAYLGVQVDDLLIADDIYTGGTFRMSPSDLLAALDYQNAKRSQTVTANMKFNWAFNGVGTVDYAPDALAAQLQQIGSSFNYISHTYDHADLDPLSASEVTTELSNNVSVASQLGLQPFSIANLVPPSYSGLTSSTAMNAELAFGIRNVVCDSSVTGYDNPSPNAGIYNPVQPQILMIPRRPTNIYYNVSTPDQEVTEYNDIYRSFWGRDLSYAEILDHESDMLAQYLLKGENDPWMFHQPDLHIYGSGQSLLGDFLDQAFAKYSSRVTVPPIAPTMDELALRVAARMSYNASGASATVDPNANTITVHVNNAATVPVTGACGGTTELYAGQPISSVTLPAGGSATLSLSGGLCGASGGTGGSGGTVGTGGTGGTVGTGGTTGTGGSTGTGGTGGTGGSGGGMAFSMSCTTLSVATARFGAGQTASALTTAELTGTTDVWTDYVELSPSSQIRVQLRLAERCLRRRHQWARPAGQLSRADHGFPNLDVRGARHHDGELGFAG